MNLDLYIAVHMTLIQTLYCLFYVLIIRVEEIYTLFFFLFVNISMCEPIFLIPIMGFEPVTSQTQAHILFSVTFHFPDS